MERDVEAYVRSYLVCQQDNMEKAKAAGTLEPLPRASRPWESISMDFITCLPRVGGHDAILVVVDHFSKYATFIPTKSEVHVDGVAHLFMFYVAKYWGLPLDIISDRDIRFTGHFWESLFKRGNGHFPAAFRFARDYHARIEEAREALERAAQRMKKYTDQHRRDVEFQAKQHHKGFVPHYDGPFKVVAKIGRVAYRLNIPRRLAVHQIFHVSILKKYILDPEDAARNQPQRAPPNVRTHFDQEAKAVLAKRKIDRGGRHGCYHKIEYLIKWKNRPEESATWERDSDLWQFENLLQAYEAEHRALTRASTSSGGEGVLGP
ncbi:uncharacterized protein LOC144705416 [Wolffia australiana]